jgi:hypothetical protein
MQGEDSDTGLKSDATNLDSEGVTTTNPAFYDENLHGEKPKSLR